MSTDRGAYPDHEGTRLAEILGSRLPVEPLIMPADEFAVLKAVAEAAGMASPSPVPSGGATPTVAAPEPVTEAMVDAALAAVAEYQRTAREAVWASPSRGQVRAMLEGAARAGQERSDEKEAGRG